MQIWDVKTGDLVNNLLHHCEAVLHLRFTNGMMVTCSKDRSIAVWDLASPTEINLRRVLVGHRAAVNVVDFDERYIVSASGDRTIKVWNTSTCEFLRTLNGHRRGIACLQYRDRLVVSGSSDNTIRLWDIEYGTCLRTLEGHEELVRCIRFDSKRIVSGAYDGKIKVWDLNAALDQRSPANQLCIRTLIVSLSSSGTDGVRVLFFIVCYSRPMKILYGRKPFAPCSMSHESLYGSFLSNSVACYRSTLVGFSDCSSMSSKSFPPHMTTLSSFGISSTLKHLQLQE